MSDLQTSKPSVAVPPPVVYLAYFFSTMLKDWRWPAPVLPTPVQFTSGGVLIGAGLAIGVLAFREFRRAGTKFNVYEVPRALVTAGIFRYTRNPVYLSVTLVYVGTAVMVDSIWILLGVLPALHWTHSKAILREEAHLEELFGEDYLTYKTRVRRWV